MSIPYVPVGSTHKIAPFKNPHIKPYGAFSNTTDAWDFPIKQRISIHGEDLNFYWPSAEHAYHAQKIIHLKHKLPKEDPRQRPLSKTLHEIEIRKNKPKDVFFPHQDYDPLIEDLLEHYPVLAHSKRDFEINCDALYDDTSLAQRGLMPNGKPYVLKFLHDVLKMKFDQHPELKNLCMACARRGVIPVAVGHHDAYLYSGENGQGKNCLGLSIIELGYQYLKASGEKTPAQDTWKTYDHLKQAHPSVFKYDQLITLTEDKHAWINPLAKSTPFRPREYATQFIQRKLAAKGCILARTIHDSNKPHMIVLQLRFSSLEEAEAFKQNYCGGTTSTSADGKTLTIGATRISTVLEKFGLYHHGHSNPVPLMQALREEDEQINANTQSMRYFKPSK